ncbi:hypothetical protein D0962_01770 [Leptolyngbyaceae cyanobacterium CCMR0082]|uniref:Uncharacterized protein n=1 Tax=Adonisia turfae CCMR0082 TaxID=2304604 RepID=A0A6M0S041_9CYAN|nr:hypothetical protein [Adonisia turfae]NEZ61513.1 hypothetical protein [Adonisia turfae CCMR0082]
MKGLLIETLDGWRIASKNKAYKLVWGLPEKLDKFLADGGVLPDWVTFETSPIYRNTVNRIVTAE